MTLTARQSSSLRSIKLERATSMEDMFSRFLKQPYPVLFDSALMVPSLGRYSYLTADPFLVVRSKGRQVEIETEGSTQRLESDPFTVLQELLGRYSLEPDAGLPPFQGGAVGYLGYELGHHIETIPYQAVDDLDLPEMAIGFYDWVLARDESSGETWIVATGLPGGSEEASRERIGWIRERLAEDVSSTPPSTMGALGYGLTSNFSHEDYLKAVDAVKEYIVQGDIYQANISHRFSVEIECGPWDLYQRLRQVSPAPYSAYLSYPEVTVVSASPEEFLRLSDGTVQTRPMKGTRPRGRDEAEDRKLAAELLASDKERAENIMIVDLMRNDLGRVCVPGTIKVPELFVVEKYPTVLQLVSTVTGRTMPGVDAVDVIKACFPGGSITGAPKIRAIEIIDELEPTQRSVYCGTIGYIGFDGSMLTSIPIRILLVKGSTAYFQVGGGIVADSQPQSEYEETIHKARGALNALGVSL